MDQLEEIAIGFCRLTVDEFSRMSFRQLNYAIEGEAIRREDEWDYVRHIIAPWCGGKPREIMKLKRDEVAERAKRAEMNNPERIAKLKEVMNKLTW